MRSSKSRSRSKTNRPRTLGNIINRVFDSSGPDGKVRGTPQQIIEKYLFLARDAQLSNDRVAAENFLQHAEHYTRMLGEAQREMAAEQDTRQPYQPQNGNGTVQNGPRDRDGQRQDQRPDGRNDVRSENRYESRSENRPENRPENRVDARQDIRREDRGPERAEFRPDSRPDSRPDARFDSTLDSRTDTQPDFQPEFRSNYRAEYAPDQTRQNVQPTRSDEVIDLSSDEELGLVETPEASLRSKASPRSEAPRREAAPRRARPDAGSEAGPEAQPDAQPEAKAAPAADPETPPAVEAAKPARAASTRRPRSPKPAATDAADDKPAKTPREAAK